MQYKEFPYTLEVGETVTAKVTKINNEYWIKIDNGRSIDISVLINGYHWKFYGRGARLHQRDLSVIAQGFDSAVHNPKTKKLNKVIPFINRIK